MPRSNIVKRPTRKHIRIIVYKLKLCNCLQDLFHCDMIAHNYMESCTIHEQCCSIAQTSFWKLSNFCTTFGGHGVVLAY